jgi:hypothetical protein
VARKNPSLLTPHRLVPPAALDRAFGAPAGTAKRLLPQLQIDVPRRTERAHHLLTLQEAESVARALHK